MKQILLLGDRVTRDYRPLLKEKFAGISLIRGLDRDTTNSSCLLMDLESLRDGCRKPDAVQWCSGIGDVTDFNREGRGLVDLKKYLENHARLGGIFKRDTAQVVFATTLPCHPDAPHAGSLNRRIEEYNAAAKEMFAGMEGYRVNDLHALVSEDVCRYMNSDNSLTEAGKELCAKATYDLLYDFVEKPNMVLFGDSLRQNYENAVQGLLWEEAKVAFPPDNSRFALYQLFTLDEMRHQLPRNVDVVHFNAGAWDRKRLPYENDTFMPIDDYLKALDRLCAAYRYYYGDDVILIYALTTPNASKNEWDDLRRWNEIAAEHMKKQGCLINDLFTPLCEDSDRYLGSDGVHLSEEGVALAAGRVADAVREALAEAKKKY